LSGKAIIFVAVIFGLIASMIVANLISDGNSGQNNLATVVSNVAIKPGAMITATDIKTASWPKHIVPQLAFQDVTKVIGRVAKQEIFPGEAIQEPMLAPIDAKAGLASTIPLGKRAITVRVNEVIAVAGFVLPGSYVDIIVSVKGSGDTMVSKTVLTRIKVIAIAQDTEIGEQKTKIVNAVTLELTPKEAELLDLARNIGNLSLALRNAFDTSQEESKGTTYQELINQADHSRISNPVPGNTSVQKRSLSVKPKSFSVRPDDGKVEMIKGTAKSEVLF
jgi:pilus assembly protein CpaB